MWIYRGRLAIYSNAMSNYEPEFALLGTPPDRNSRGSVFFANNYDGCAQQIEIGDYLLKVYLLEVQPLGIPDDCIYGLGHYIISRKICIVRHWKYREKLIIHPSRLCLVFGLLAHICRIYPLFCVLLRFCLYFRIFYRLS